MADIPPQLTQAIVTLEDPRFLDHGGFDVMGILRASVKNVVKFRYAQGGSTITQQLVKNVFLTNERTLSRKFTELVLSALVEKRFTKDEILEAYMNEVYLGQIGSYEIHGVGRAAEYYFGKKLDALQTHEIALLAAMIAGPGFYSPWNHPERTKARRDKVLRLLSEAQLILPEEMEKSTLAELPKRSSFVSPTRSAYLMDALRADLIASRSEMEILKGGFDVRLALDIDLQERAEKVLTAKSIEWKQAYQGLVVAADPRDCTIKAYVGGTNYGVTQLDRIRQSRRPIGSLMKPLEIASLLDEDATVNLAMRLEDRPLTWEYDGGRQKWSPFNYDGKFRGPVSLRQSIEESINVPIVRLFFEREPTGLLAERLDPLRALGLEIPKDRALPSALLGAIDQTPRQTLIAFLKLTRRALGIAQDAGDFGCTLGFEEVRPVASGDAPKTEGTLFARPETEEAPSATYGQQGARLVLAALEGAIRRGTGAALGNRLPEAQPWASKTGTSNDKRDSWYVAISPELVILSWVGRDDNKETPFTGSSGALPVVSAILTGVGKLKPNPEAEIHAWTWPMPRELTWKPIDAEKGCLPSDETLFKLGGNTMTPKSATPPPAPFLFDGTKYVYEMFREGALPARCE